MMHAKRATTLAVLGCVLVLAPAGAATGPAPRQELDQADTIARLTHDLEKMDRAIDETKSIMRASLDAPYLPDLYFRLAELYVEKSRFEHARGVEQQVEGKKALSEDKSLAVQLSKKIAIETYQKIATDFPSYERLDQVYFFKGHEFRELGQFESMLKEYGTLISRFSLSKWAMEARLILGDHYYDKGDATNAERYYKEIIALPESHVHAMARYKLGWIRINGQDYKAALDLFKDAVLSGRRDANKKTESRTLNVRREALLAMAWPFSEVRKPQQAVAFFRGLADNKASYLDVLRKLANRYHVKSKGDAAALLYREVIRLSSQSEDNLEYVERVVNAVQDMPADKLTRHATVDVDVRGITTTMARLKARPEAVKVRADAPHLDEAKIDTELELQARDMATRAQTYAQDNRDKKVSRAAAQAYGDYLDTFAGHKEQQTMARDRAGALFDAGAYLPAAMQYEDVATTAPEKSRQAFVYNAVVSYHRALDEDAERRTTSPDRSGTLNKLQLLQAREGLKQLGAYFIQKFPGSDKVPDVRFNVARMHYQGGDFGRSVDLFVEFIHQHPAHKDVGTAGHLALDALYKLERLDDMMALADALAKDPRIVNAEFKGEAAQIAQQARRRKVEFTVVGTSEADFGKKMMSEWEKNKGTKEGEEYLYAAFSKFKGQGDIAATLEFGEKLMGAYPSNKYGAEIIGTMGSYLARSADFERAAWLYEELQKRAPKDRASIDSLASAADIRAFLGDVEQATRDYSIVREQGTGEARAHATAKLFELAEGAEAWDRVAAVAASEGRPTVMSGFYAGLAAARRGDGREARSRFAEVEKMSANGDEEEELQARAEFELARVVHVNFDTLQFRGAAGAEGVIGAKLQLMNDTEHQYVSALHSGSAAWGIAATFELSRLYHDFGAFIMQAPVPPRISEAQYRAALQEQADPYFEKSKATLKACAQKAEQLKVLSPYAAACVAGVTTEVVSRKTSPQRSGGDEAYKADMARGRAEMMKNPKNTDVLKTMARRAIAAGDIGYARLILSEISELSGDTKAIDGIMGLVLWHAGEPQAAAAALERARRTGQVHAGLNLAGLYYSFGLTRLAKSVMPEPNKVDAIDLDAPEIHPLVRKMIRAAERGGRDE